MGQATSPLLECVACRCTCCTPGTCLLYLRCGIWHPPAVLPLVESARLAALLHLPTLPPQTTRDSARRRRRRWLAPHWTCPNSAQPSRLAPSSWWCRCSEWERGRLLVHLVTMPRCCYKCCRLRHALYLPAHALAGPQACCTCPSAHSGWPTMMHGKRMPPQTFHT